MQSWHGTHTQKGRVTTAVSVTELLLQDSPGIVHQAEAAWQAAAPALRGLGTGGITPCSHQVLCWQMSSGDHMHVASPSQMPQLQFQTPRPGFGEQRAPEPSAVAGWHNLDLHACLNSCEDAAL